jgi:hypothetical protein
MSGGNLYKNVKEKLYAVDRNLWGKSFGKGLLKLSMEIRRRN